MMIFLVFFAFSVARNINFTVRPQNFEFYVDFVMFWFFSMMQLHKHDNFYLSVMYLLVGSCGGEAGGYNIKPRNYLGNTDVWSGVIYVSFH